MIKLSPMLDWRKAVEDIGKEHVSAVHIVSVNNECKELLILVECGGRSVEGEYSVHCVNLLSDGSEERFEFDAQTASPTKTSHFSLLTFHFLFSPNASVMKAGCFDLLAERFGVKPLHANSHLFVSDAEVPDFPGRGFIVEKMISYIL